MSDRSTLAWRIAGNRFLSWFVDWIPGDWTDTKHCTYWMWRLRLSGWFVCPRKGHDWYPDHCGRRDHDVCDRCQDVRGTVR